MGVVIQLSNYRTAKPAPVVRLDAEAEDRASVLRLEAADLQQRADELMVVEAEYAGRAAGRRRDGDLAGAAHYDALQKKTQAEYLELDELAFQKRLEVCALHARADFLLVASDLAALGRPEAL
jgi:hypothetical protein